MKPRTTTILVLLAAAVVAAILLWERHRPGTDARREAASKLAPELETDDVSAISIASGAERVEARRIEGEWRLVHPLNDLAQRAEIEGAIAAIRDARVVSRVEDEALVGASDPSGLDAPRLLLSLTTSEGPLSIAFGSEPAPGGGRYVRIGGGSTLAIVAESLPASLERSARNLRERSLIDLDSRGVHALEIACPEGRTLALTRDPDRTSPTRTWRAMRPFEDAVDDALVSVLLSEIGAARIDRFADERETDEGGVTLTLEIGAALEENAPFRESKDQGRPESTVWRLSLGRAVAGSDGLRRATVSRRDGVFEVFLPELLAACERDLDAWRSRVALSFPVWDVKRVELEVEGERLVAFREAEGGGAGGVWRVAEPAGFDLDVDALERALASLARIDAERVLPRGLPEGAASPRPEARVVVHLAGHAEPIALSVTGSVDDGRLVAHRPDRPVTLLLDREILQTLEPSTLALAAGEPRAAPSGD